MSAWIKADKLAISIRLVGAMLAFAASVYAVKPIAYNVLGMSRVSEVRNAQVVYSIKRGNGIYSVQIKSLRPECSILSLNTAAYVDGTVYPFKVERNPYRLSREEGWVSLYFNVHAIGLTEKGFGTLFGAAQYKCPEGIVATELPANSMVEVVE